MADLQAEIELTIELRKFVNIDLFVQGYIEHVQYHCLFIFCFCSVIIKFVRESNLRHEFNRQRRLKLNPNFQL